MNRCELCNTPLRNLEGCPSCALYNAAVAAQKAAANDLARARFPNATDAWMNEYGIFADINGRKHQVGSAEEAAPFVALTGVARRVATFWRGPVCATCHDTHTMHLRGRGVPCTRCPRPCDRCRQGGVGPYCEKTPCACECHAAGGTR